MKNYSKENLDVTHYRNGDPIPNVTDPDEWSNLTTGAWCYYDNDPEKGILYNWHAVNDSRGLAPEGWEIPNIEELEQIDLTTGLLGGYRVSVGAFCFVGDFGYWWSSSEGDTSNAWGRNLYYNNGYAYQYSSNKQYGLSVRCLKNLKRNNMMPTAEEFLIQQDCIRNVEDFFNDVEPIDLIEFAKIHVEAALKAASEKAYVEYIDLDTNEIFDYTNVITNDNVGADVNKKSILNAYSIENIK